MLTFGTWSAASDDVDVFLDDVLAARAAEVYLETPGGDTLTRDIRATADAGPWKLVVKNVDDPIE